MAMGDSTNSGPLGRDLALPFPISGLLSALLSIIFALIQLFMSLNIRLGKPIVNKFPLQEVPLLFRSVSIIVGYCENHILSPTSPYILIKSSSFVSIWPREPVPKVVKKSVREEVCTMSFSLISCRFSLPNLIRFHARLLVVPTHAISNQQAKLAESNDAWEIMLEIIRAIISSCGL